MSPRGERGPPLWTISHDHRSSILVGLLLLHGHELWTARVVFLHCSYRLFVGREETRTDQVRSGALWSRITQPITVISPADIANNPVPSPWVHRPFIHSTAFPFRGLLFVTQTQKINKCRLEIRKKLDPDYLYRVTIEEYQMQMSLFVST